MGVDPLAIAVPNYTPQHYVHNNPVGFVDPTGMRSVAVHGATTQDEAARQRAFRERAARERAFREGYGNGITNR